MDDISIISIPDSDISTHTLIDADTPPAQGDDSTPNQQFYACSLFINHWNSTDGTCKGNEDLRSAKKSYVDGLKEKPTETPTIVFAKHNWKDEMISVSSRSSGRCRSPIKSSKSDKSRKRKSTDWPIDSDKRKRDVNHNNLVGITERRKTVVNTQPSKTATIARRKTIFIENPVLSAKKSDRKNTSASVQTRNVKTNLPSSPTSSGGSAKFGGHRLATTSSNHTVTSATAHLSQHASNSDWIRSPHREVQPTSSSHRHASSTHRTASSSHRTASSSHRHVSSSHRHASSSHRPESLTQRQSSSPSSASMHQSSTREHKTKNRRSSKDSHRSHSKKMRLSGDKPKSKQFSDSTKKHDAAPLNSFHPENVLRETQKVDGITADMLHSSIKIAEVKSLVREVDIFGKDHYATEDASSRENILKNYKIPKTGGSFKSKPNDENVSPTKSTNKIKTLPRSEPATTSKTPKRPKNDEPSTESNESQTRRNDCKQKKKSNETSTSGQKTSDTIKLCQRTCDQPDVPELDDCTVPEAMNPKVIVKPLKFNPLNRNAIGKKEAIASGDYNYIVRYKKHNRIKITKGKTETYKNPELEYLSTRETTATEEVSTVEVLTEEVATEKVTIEAVATEEVAIEKIAIEKVAIEEVATVEVAAEDVSTEEVATEEVATEEVATEEVATEEVATEEIATEEVATEEIVTEEVACDEVATNEVATNEVATNEVATNEVATNEVATNEVAIDSNKDNKIDSSQQTISVFTSNFEAQKNDEETDALLKKQEASIAMFTLSVKNYEKCIKENDQTISAQGKTIHEQQQMIIQIIKEREQKMKEYEAKIKMQEQKMHFMNLEIEMLHSSTLSMAEMLKDTSKPKSRRPTTSRLSTSRPQNTSATSNMNGLSNDIRRISPPQPQPTPIRVKHIDQLTGISPPLFQNPSTLPQSTYTSSATITTQLLTNPASGITGANSGPKSGYLAQMLMNPPNTVSNEIPTSIDNSGQITQYSTYHTNAQNNAFLNSNGNNGQITPQFPAHHTNAQNNAVPTSINYSAQTTSQSSVHHTNAQNNAFLNSNGNNGQTTPQFPTHHTNAQNNSIPTSINFSGQTTSQSSTHHTNAQNNAFLNSNGNNGQTTSRFPTHHTNAQNNAIPTSINYSAQTTTQSSVHHTNAQNNAFLNSNGNNGQTTSQFPTHHKNAQNNAIPTSINYSAQTTTQSSVHHTNAQNNAFLNSNGNNGQTTPQFPTHHTNAQNNSIPTSINFSGQTTSQSSTHHTNPIPHQMLARQPERTKSTATRPSTSITINPLQNTQLRNRSLTFYDPHRRNLQPRQPTVSQQAQAQNTVPVYQPTGAQQPVFYCLGCYKTATLVCRTCRNYCSCSNFCYDLIAAKHKNECILPNMVSISNL